MADVHTLTLEAALRHLQIADGLQNPGQHLTIAQSLLGEAIGLVCTGVDDGGGFFSHNGDTCPIHEWLVPSDYENHVLPAEEQLP